MWPRRCSYIGLGAGICRSASASTLKNSLAVNPNIPASRFAGNNCVLVLNSRTDSPLPVYVEASVLALPALLINGGRRGYLLGLAPVVLVSALGAQAVNCAI